MSTGENPFQTADPWDVSLDTMLPIGNHVVFVREAHDGSAKSTGNPQLELKFENDKGSIKAWETYHSEFLGKVVALYDAAGIDRPREGEFDPEDNCRLTAGCRQRLLDRKVGIVVREEAGYNDPSKMRRRVQGYVDPAQINADIPADTAGLATTTGTASKKDDTIPF